MKRFAMRISVIIFAIVLISAVPRAFAADVPAAKPQPQKLNAMARLLPEDPMFVIIFDGTNEPAKKTALFQILHDPEIEKAFAVPLATFKKMVSESAKAQGKMDPTPLAAFFDTKIAFCFLGLGQGAAMQPEVLFVIETGAADSPASKGADFFIKTLIAQYELPADAFKPVKIEGVDARVADVPAGKVGYATQGGFFFFGSGGALGKAFARDAKLDRNENFRRISRETGGEEFVYIHANVDKLKFQFAPFMPAPAAMVIGDKDVGVGNVKSVTLSTTGIGTGLKTTLFVQTNGAPCGLLKILGGKPLDAGILKLAPRSSEFFYATSIDPGELWDYIAMLHAKSPKLKAAFDEQVKKMNEEMKLDIRKDLVGSVGDEIAVFGPDLTFAVRMRDPQKFTKSLDLILKYIAEAAAREDVEFKDAKLTIEQVEYCGQIIKYVQGQKLPMMIQPSYVVSGDYAVFSFSTIGVKSYITKMTRGETMAGHGDFRTLRGKLGAARPTSIYFTETKQTCKDIYKLLPTFFGLGAMAEDAQRALVPNPAQLPPFEAFEKHLFGCAAHTRTVEDGVIWEAYSPFGIPFPPQIQTSVGAVEFALFTSVFTPAVVEAFKGATKKPGEFDEKKWAEERLAREAPPQDPDAANLAKLAIAVNVWMLAHGENNFYPPALRVIWDAEIIVETQVFLSPAGDTKLKDDGSFITDYECILDLAKVPLAAADTPADIPLAWIKGVDGKRLVGYFDAHVEQMTEAEFQAMYKNKIEPFIAKAKLKAAARKFEKLPAQRPFKNK